MNSTSVRNSLAATALTLVLAGCATTSPAPRQPARPPGGAAGDTSVGVASGGLRSTIVDGATAMIGQPYRWGGAAPGGFDCSGLVLFATARAGLRVPRTAQEQMRTGTRIPRRELTAGDLVFMHLARKELHVGIAIDNQRFVHAPATGRRVRIDSLDLPPYAQGFLEARRIVAPGAVQLPSGAPSAQ